MDTDINQCFLNMKTQFTGENRFIGNILADAYYIPSSYAERFIKVSNLFVKYNVFLEIAVPSIIMCLSNGTHLPFSSIIDGASKRRFPYKHFTPEELLQKTFGHPFKWSRLVNSTGIRHDGTVVKSAKSFICNNMLPSFYFKGPFDIQCSD